MEKVITFHKGVLAYCLFCYFVCAPILICISEGDYLTRYYYLFAFLTAFILMMVRRILKEKLVLTENEVNYFDGKTNQRVLVDDIKEIKIYQGSASRELALVLKGYPEKELSFNVHSLEEHFFAIPRWVYKIKGDEVLIDPRLLSDKSFIYLSRFRYVGFASMFLAVALFIAYARMTS